MSAGTSIEWTDTTWNPVTGCSKVSPGCDHCYMFQMYPRLKAFGSPGYQAAPDEVTLLPERLGEPRSWRKQRRVFVNSMSDTFHREVPDYFLSAMFERMTWASEHQFQVLTKRPGRAAAFWAQAYEGQEEWPANVWLGTSVESQKYVPRIDVLARVPAPVRFVSAEPLLGPLNLQARLPTIQWLIIGGESGPGARPMKLAWAGELLMQARDAHVRVFIKQLGSAWAKKAGAKHPKGGDMAEWPEALRVREFPA